ncbi:MAG: SusC/RagA family TonB-linked outer membrane protein [Prevotella sp.]|nr:SusC/RagA family TonB-linked outer membrane protein [Prevotella sp.]
MQHCKSRKRVLQLSLAILLGLAPLSFPTIAKAETTQVKSDRVTLSLQNVTVEQMFSQIKKQTGYNFVISSELSKNLRRVSVTANNEAVKSVLERVLNPLNCTFDIDGRVITIYRKLSDNRNRTISGYVKDENGEVLVGVPICIGDSRVCTVTDANGFYTFKIPSETCDIKLTYVGMKTQYVTIPGGTAPVNRDVVMGSDTQLEEVVVTGIFTRKKESFTGSAATYTAKELKDMGTSNVLQSLKTLDPAFAIIDDTQFGSDPNRLPNMEIRGKSSMLGQRDELANDPNQPLFILDGFESSLQAINDLDINRIESITILKDAASTAIYGSKAANGVVVVETVKPKAGQLQVSYTGNFNVTVPDLSSYNMMDATEKTEFERLAGKYDPDIVETPYRTDTEIRLGEQYYERLRSIAQGVNTDWLAQPVRVGVNQKHSLYVQGGSETFMFGIGGMYNGNTGVMKGSDREVFGGNLDMIYRVKKFQFSNKFSLSNASYNNPLVAFQEYVSANPYYRIYGDEGMLTPWLEYSDDVKMPNPLYNASLNSRNHGNDLTISNHFQAEWTPNEMWKARARFGVTYDTDAARVFTSPDNTNQILNKVNGKRGEYTKTSTNALSYEGDVSLTFAKLFAGIHRINAVIGGDIYHTKTSVEGYTAEGFPQGDFRKPSFAAGYLQDGVPTYYDAISRSVNGYLNFGYALMDRYLMDFSLRENGSSVFGSSSKWNTTWSVGLGWNIHMEPFIQDNFKWINYFKLRGSWGNPGNQSFDSGRTLITYALQSGNLNYFGIGALAQQIGNPNLKWQITQDKNVGLDLTLFDNRVSFTVDYFHKVTDPLLIGITMPLSSGTTSYFSNAGKQTSQGMTFTAQYYILRNLEKRIMWSIRATGRTQTNEINGIGNMLDAFNNSGRGSSTTRYFDGADPDDIWVVKSAGIDPSTGKELFYDLDGNPLYDYSYDYEQVCGNSRPDLEGVLGSSLTIGGFSASVNFRYQLGADVFNTALWNKVENVDMLYNQDRRALYERWHKAGDIVSFKDIRDVNPSPMTSRFIQNEKTLTLESVHLEYQFFSDSWIKHLGLGSLRVFADARDLVRLSTIRAERGTTYPFARTIECGVSLNF